MRRLGFLQLDPIATVATPQELVLWSRLGSFDRGELDRLLWEERALFEWNAFIWPIESLPMVRGLIRRRRTSTHYAHERWMHGFMAENRSFRRYVMRELERRGPLLSRELDDRAAGEPRDHRWYGTRRVGHMLTILHLWGEIAVAGRRGRQRLWDLAERVYPAGSAMTQAQARRALEEQRFRALGVRLEKGRLIAHPDATDGPIPDRATLLSPFDRLIHDRDRTEALWDFFYRLEMYVTPGQARVRLLRPAAARGRPPRRAGRAGRRPQERHHEAAGRLGRHIAPRRGDRPAGGVPRGRAAAASTG